VIVVVEGPSAAGKTTWCRRHAARWLPEPQRWSIEEVRRYQIDRWRQAVAADEAGEVIVLDGDPFKLYCSWAQLKLGEITDAELADEAGRASQLFTQGDYGCADIVLYGDPGVEELTRRNATDASRTRRNFERHTAMRPFFRRWYEAVAVIDPTRVVWQHPATGLPSAVLECGPRPARSSPELLDRVLEQLM
jgi:hypothetical protein